MGRASILWDWDVGTGAVEWSEHSPVPELALVAELATEAAWAAAIDPADLARVQQARAAARTSAPLRWTVAYRLRLASGAVQIRERGSVALDAGGRAFHAAGVVELVDGDHAREARRAHPGLTAEQLGLFFDWLPQLAWSTDAEGWIDFYNRRWFAYTGTTFEQMEGWGWIAVHDPDDLPRITRLYRRAFSTGQAWEDEFRLRRASDGMMRWHLSRAMPVRDASGAIVRWFGTNTDIHDQKLASVEHSRLLARAERARAEAEAANAARDRFLAMVSHELRTPLNAVLGWAQLLAGGNVAAARVPSVLGKIEANALAQAKLIDDLLDVSRIIGGKLDVGHEALDLVPVIDAAIDTVRPLAEKASVELVCARATASIAIVGDRDRLQQVMVNLLTNAIKFGKAGGRVEIEAAATEQEARTTIRDFGAGLTPEQIARLFDPFWQANPTSTRTHGGLGLGLAIARHLVELHDGAIAVQSDGPSTGATFTVTLPLARAAVAPRRAPAAATGAPSLAGIHVLVVDDEPSAREVLASVVLSAGATVATAASVAEAIRTLRGARFDVVLSDIAMPEVSGYELVPRARELPGYDRLPMVALTAYAAEADRAAALRAGYDRHLAKPLDVRAVTGTVLELVRPGPK